MRREPPAGHRLAAHTADLRIEAWAPTRERCVAEAVLGLVGSFLDGPLPEPAGTVEYELVGSGDEDLLVAALDEVIYRLETRGEVPVTAEVSPVPTGARVRSAVVDACSVVATGAIPKAVSLHELRCERDREGWSCSVTVDV